MSNLRAVVGLVFVAALLTGAGCGSKTVRNPGASPAQNRDAGNKDTGGSKMDAAPTPGASDTCQVMDGEERRGPNQVCGCNGDCTTGSCEGNVCCSGAACGAKRPEGAACSDPGQCMSGFCADGVCCNVACTGACLACDQPDMMGECEPVGAGLEDRHGLCQKDSQQSCGQSGVCNGQGGCAKYPADTICALGACDPAGLFVPPSTCDGEGQCVAGVGISCSPSKCDATKGECVRICTGSEQCVEGKACLAGSCGLRGPGQACMLGTDCASKFCVDGVCCENACEGACQTCSNPMNLGKCVPVANGVADAACGAATPTSSCGNDGKCDGKGVCRKWDNNTTCRPARCDAASNSQVLAAKCNNGKCPAEQKKNCTPYKGCASATACLGSCGSDSQCDGTNICTKGSCGKLPVGGKCTSNGDCANGICGQGGYCCNSACGGACKSCGLAGSLGTCTNVTAGSTDPNGGCKDECSKVCDGNGACRREPTNTPCGGSPTCSGNTVVQKKCNAGGTCAQANQTCTGGTPNCNGGACTAPVGKDAGAQCVTAGECKAGLSCVAASGGKNICCTQACGGSCQFCADSGTGCANRPDNTSCGGTSKCSGGLCCGDGTTKCGNACINLQTNKDNCGTCGNKCATGQSCKMGTCMVDCADTICPVNKCVDLKSDVNNCGTCGKQCGSNSVCSNSTCGCATGFKSCTVGGNAVCINVMGNNEAHCGDCNKACAGTCTAGVCAVVDPCVGKNCNDNNACTNDSCAAGECVHTNNTNACSPPVGGKCEGGTCKAPDLCAGKDCNDNNACTNDSCNSSNGNCVHTNNTNACSPPVGGKCDEGTCKLPDPCEGKNCNDNNACTNDSCNSSNGNCVHTNNTNACSPPVGGKCDEGTCKLPDPCEGKNCNDNNACTNDSCNSSNGNCVHTNNTNACSPPVGGKCDEGTCKLPDPCEGKNCNDNNACTNDSCNSSNGNCVHTNNTNSCSPPAGGKCDEGTCKLPDLCEGKNCNDNNACTNDSCNSSNGDCVHTNNTNSCSPPQGGKCEGGTCKAQDPCEGKNCNDSNPCTDDSCNSSNGDCVHNNNTDSCSPPEGGKCEGGSCKAP